MHILEAQDRPAKKILATGNGKCNYTNEKMALSCYRSAFISQAEEVLSQYPPSAAITYLKELGIWPSERDGYYYPSSGQAASVAECLLMEAKRLGIVIHTDSPVTQVKNKNNEFIAVTSQGEHFESRVLIIAAGSLAGMKEGKLVDPQGFCRTLGLKVQPTVPALTALVQEKDPIGKIWSGSILCRNCSILRSSTITVTVSFDDKECRKLVQRQSKESAKTTYICLLS